jgi:hypothetical protein
MIMGLRVKLSNQYKICDITAGADKGKSDSVRGVS